jgi:putative aminopeptidase FrvX
MAKNSSRSVQLLEQLSTAFGVSGFEDDVRDVIAQLVRPLVDEMRVDPLGNLIVTRKGKSDFRADARRAHGRSRLNY